MLNCKTFDRDASCSSAPSLIKSDDFFPHGQPQPRKQTGQEKRLVEPVVNTTSDTTRFHHLWQPRNGLRRDVRVWFVALFCVVLLVGCGPESSGADPEELAAEAERIALTYVTDGDIGNARGQIESLDAANPKQWLLLHTEAIIAEGGDPTTIAALIQLTGALGLESAAVSTYASENGLLGSAQPVAEAIVVALTPVAMPSTSNSTGSSAEAQSDESGTEETDSAPSSGADETADDESDADDSSDNESSAEDADDEPEVIVALPTPTPTPESAPKVRADTALNLRRGPGLLYDIIGGLQAGDEMAITGKNDAADWWQVKLPGDIFGWVYGPLVQTVGDVNAVAVAADIPPPPEQPTPAPEPVVEAPEPAPVEEEEAPASSSDQPNFTLVERRLWSKPENGGCAGQHLLRIHVLDASGNRINGVALQGIYIGEILVTGSQGKGDGVIEYDLHGSGEGFRVIRDNDGREATSDGAEGFTTRSVDIPVPTLIEAGYCSNEDDCNVFYNSWGCQGHHSWDAVFQRNY